jgi:translation initiation factor 1
LDDSAADPFDAENDDFEQTDSTKESYIHIRIQQRNGRKTLTTLQGLSKGGSISFRFRVV